jgi:hypothetical protein
MHTVMSDAPLSDRTRYGSKGYAKEIVNDKTGGCERTGVLAGRHLACELKAGQAAAKAYRA